MAGQLSILRSGINVVCRCYFLLFFSLFSSSLSLSLFFSLPLFLHGSHTLSYSFVCSPPLLASTVILIFLVIDFCLRCGKQPKVTIFFLFLDWCTKYYVTKYPSFSHSFLDFLNFSQSRKDLLNMQIKTRRLIHISLEQPNALANGGRGRRVWV